MKFTIAIITLLSFHESEHFATATATACSKEYRPVFCSSTSTSKDYNEFSNLCLATEAGFEEMNCQLLDPNRDETLCSTIRDPVICTSTETSRDRREFSNPCFAKEAGFKESNCVPDATYCPTIFDPVVCASGPTNKDHRVFDNICLAEKEEFDPANCDPLPMKLVADDDYCPSVIDPVICTSTATSKDHKTFPNICLAETKGFDAINCVQYDDFICPTVIDPVTCTSIPAGNVHYDFDNMCVAGKEGFDPKSCEPTSNVPADDNNNVDEIICPTPGIISERIICTIVSEPAKKDYRSFENMCLAEKEGFEESDCEPASNKHSDDDGDDNGACPTVIDPVICTSTPRSKDYREFQNMCFAVKDGFENCKPKLDDVNNEDIVCTEEYKPVVCTSTPKNDDYNKFSNLCYAEKAGYDSMNCNLKVGGLRG